MKTLKLLALVGMVFLLMPQCKKPEECRIPEEKNIQPVNLSKLTIPNWLDWKMTHPVNSNITDASIDLT